MGSKIKAIFLFVVIGGVILYLLNASFFSKGVGSLSSLFSLSSSSRLFGFNTSTVTGPAIGPSIPQGPPVTTIGPPTQPQSNPTVPPADIPAGFTASQLSPYFHEIRFGSVSPGTPYYYGTISLETDITQNETVDITGWQIKTQDSGEYIPQAINVYDPSGLTAPSDIRIKENDTVYLYSSSAPFNLRLNECVGYIAQIAKFSPPLPETCPAIDYSAIQNFTGQCQNYIYSLSSCSAPDMSNPEIPLNDYSCRNYLENNFNYKTCFDAHAGDPNFLNDQVWVWTGSNVLNYYHDRVELLDRNGLLVDLETY